MSDTREKLIELLSVPIYPHLDADPAEVVADYLIANGVRLETETSDKTSDEKTSEWIPVSERLPEEVFTENGTASDLVLVTVMDSLGNKFVVDDITVNGGEWVNFSFPEYEVTHWMPLPEPPKGE